MSKLDEVLENARNYSSAIILNFPQTNVYHDITFAQRLHTYVANIGEHVGMQKDDIILAQIGAWLVAASHGNIDYHISKKGVLESNLEEKVIKTTNDFLKNESLDKVFQEQLLAAIPEIVFSKAAKSNISKLIVDGMIADFVMENPKKKLKKFHKELILKNVSISQKKWYDVAINISSNLEFVLPYCKEEHQPKINQLTLDLLKEKKQLEKNSDLAIRKELDISEAELKEVKKNLMGAKGRDARAIQTAFRTTSKNHYTLNEMVDKKANIMITVNSIILSLVLGGVLGQDMRAANYEAQIQFIPVFALTLTAMGSIIFAILSIRPDLTHGQFTAKDISEKKGNLLFYGNFHQMKERDFEWGFLQMINDQDHLYSTMIKDIYYLGQVLHRKYKQIRVSLTIFLIGLIVSVLLNIFINVFCMV